MLAGRLDRRVDILRASITTGEYGEEEKAWPTLATRWASKADVSDGEKLRAQAVGATLTTRFQVRFDSVTSTLTAEDRIRCEGRDYDLVGVKEIGRREGLELTAVSRADAA